MQPVDLAQKLNISQASISGTENRSDVIISQISKFIETGGGRLELVATLPNHAPVKRLTKPSRSSPRSVTVNIRAEITSTALNRARILNAFG